MLTSFFVAALAAAPVIAQKCSLTQKCPEDLPCCSQYGDCGVGAFCLGGCDPRMSYSLDSCAPAPVCQDKTIKFDNINKTISDVGTYLGDPSKADWMAQGEPVQYKDYALLTMPKNSDGTVLASTEYMWYGTVKATMKTSRGKGVVTAFILLSDVKDEIDYEWVGTDLQQAQTNYYFQGIPDYTHSDNSSVSDTFSNWHEYEIKWTPDKIEWLIDGESERISERKDTWNKTSQSWEFPQTPARIQLSIWPGGKASNAKGTIDWAGGVIDWDSGDAKDGGYFYAAVKEVKVECYSAKSAPGTNKGKSYIYNDIKGTNDTVEDTDKDTIMASFHATGLDMDAGKSDDDEDKDKAAIPGGGSPGLDHSDDGKSSNDNLGGGSGTDGSGGAVGGSNNCDIGQFNQDCGSSKSTGGDGNGKSDGSKAKASASALAMVIAACGLFWF